MLFCGLSKVFSTKDDQQYESIGRFWDFMAEHYGRENVRGLGYRWTTDTITYVIGLKCGELSSSLLFPDAQYQKIRLPEEGWVCYHGKTDQLPQLYGQIYSEGALTYEIEEFFENGDCRVWIFREEKDPA